MRTLTINIPDNIELNDLEAKLMLASKLFEKGKLSFGQASEFVGLSAKAFMELLESYEISVFNYPVSDIENDIENARNYSI